ncbi:MAG: CopD family protein, partial [Geminicoccaceae bacterium]
QLGHPEALWQTGYGRVLAVKIGLVGLIALASYLHAVRLRPALLAANPHPSRASERRHWRLLAVEPWLAVGAIAAVAVLVTFPLPPRQFSETNEAEASAACNPCPLPKPAPDQLAVAEQAGSRIAAFWLRHVGSDVRGSVRLLDANERPVDAPLELPGGSLTSCGTGCWRLEVPDAGPSLTAITTEDGKVYRATVPTVWRRASTLARRLVGRAQDAMRRAQSIREEERLTSGPGTFARTIFTLRAPDRFAYRTSSGAASVVIGRRQWTRVTGSAWRRSAFGGSTPFRTRDFFRWTPYARTARLLSLRGVHGRRIAEVALMDPATPVWFRLRIDLATKWIDADRMITGAHFMRRRYVALRPPVEIRPPKSSVAAR